MHITETDMNEKRTWGRCVAYCNGGIFLLRERSEPSLTKSSKNLDCIYKYTVIMYIHGKEIPFVYTRY